MFCNNNNYMAFGWIIECVCTDVQHDKVFSLLMQND